MMWFSLGLLLGLVLGTIYGAYEPRLNEKQAQHHRNRLHRRLDVLSNVISPEDLAECREVVDRIGR
jgi:hypothetical protein